MGKLRTYNSDAFRTYLYGEATRDETIGKEFDDALKAINRIDIVQEALAPSSVETLSSIGRMFFSRGTGYDPNIERLGRMGTQGLAGIAEGLLGAGAWMGLPTQGLADDVNNFIQDITPKNPNAIEELASGMASMAGLMIPGAGAAGFAGKVLSATPKIARALQIGIPTILEAFTEAGGTRNQMIREGKSEDEADKAARVSALANMITIGLTNKFGIFAEGRKLKDHIFSSLLEGSQEGLQNIIDKFAQGKEINWEEVANDFKIGAILGGAVKATGMTDRIIKEQEPIELGKEQKSIEVDKTIEIENIEETGQPITDEDISIAIEDLEGKKIAEGLTEEEEIRLKGLKEEQSKQPDKKQTIINEGIKAGKKSTEIVSELKDEGLFERGDNKLISTQRQKIKTEQETEELLKELVTSNPPTSGRGEQFVPTTPLERSETQPEPQLTDEEIINQSLAKSLTKEEIIEKGIKENKTTPEIRKDLKKENKLEKGDTKIIESKRQSNLPSVELNKPEDTQEDKIPEDVILQGAGKLSEDTRETLGNNFTTLNEIDRLTTDYKNATPAQKNSLNAQIKKEVQKLREKGVDAKYQSGKVTVDGQRIFLKQKPQLQKVEDIEVESEEAQVPFEKLSNESIDRQTYLTRMLGNKEFLPDDLKSLIPKGFGQKKIDKGVSDIEEDAGKEQSKEAQIVRDFVVKLDDYIERYGGITFTNGYFASQEEIESDLDAYIEERSKEESEGDTSFEFGEEVTPFDDSIAGSEKIRESRKKEEKPQEQVRPLEITRTKQIIFEEQSKSDASGYRLGKDQNAIYVVDPINGKTYKFDFNGKSKKDELRAEGEARKFIEDNPIKQPEGEIISEPIFDQPRQIKSETKESENDYVFVPAQEQGNFFNSALRKLLVDNKEFGGAKEIYVKPVKTDGTKKYLNIKVQLKKDTPENRQKIIDNFKGGELAERYTNVEFITNKPETKPTVERTKAGDQYTLGSEMKPQFPIAPIAGRGEGKGAEGTPLFEQKPEDKSQENLFDDYNKARKNLRNNLNNLSSAGLLNPELYRDLYKVGSYHFRQGATKFADFAKKMISDLGDWVKPRLAKLFKEIRDEFAKKAIELQQRNPFFKTTLNVAEDKEFFKNIAKKPKEEIYKEAEENPIWGGTYADKARGQYKETLEDTKDFIRKAAGNIGDMIEKISPEIWRRIRQFDMALGKRQIQIEKIFNPFFEKFSKMSKGEISKFGVMVYNRDFKSARELAKKYDFVEEFDRLMNYKDHLAGILKIKQISDHFPRMVSDSKAFLNYLEEKFPNEYRDIFGKLIREAEAKRGKLSDDDKATLINNALRGYNPGIKLSDLGNFKKRAIPILDAEIARFYHDPATGLYLYLNQQAELIEERRLFGAGGFDPEKSLGNLILKLRIKLPSTVTSELTDLLKARFNKSRAENKLFKAIRSIGIATKLANPFATLTQIKDLSFSIAESPTLTAKTLMRALKERQYSPEEFAKREGFTLEEIGWTNSRIAQELASITGRQSMVNDLLKVSGFTSVDMIGKEVRINTVWEKFKVLARENPDDADFNRRLERYFGKGAEKAKVISDLKAGRKSDSVSFLLFNELANVQPITLTELPYYYNKYGNWRIAYFLKTFGIRQMNFFLKETAGVIRDKNLPVEQRKEGWKNLMKLGITLPMVGGSVDLFRSWLISLLDDDKELSFPEEVLDNLLNIAMLSRYDAQMFNYKGVEGFIGNKLIPPMDIISSTLQDAITIIESRDRSIKTIKELPIIGRILYEYLKNH